MNKLDWIMFVAYLVISIIAIVQLKTKGVAGVDYSPGKSWWTVLGIGLMISIYLIVRHPWYCLIWACVGSLLSGAHMYIKLRRTQHGKG